MKSTFLQIVLSLSLLASAGIASGQDSLHHVCTYFWKNNLPVNGIDIQIEGIGFLPVPFTMFLDGDPSSNCLEVEPIGPGPTGAYLNVFGSSETNYLNGVTILDLQLISHHILNLQPISSPYALMAADANKSGSITTFDIVEIRKLLLGTYLELPNSESWRVLPQNCTFFNISNPFNGIICPQLPALNPGETTDLVGFKVGDVNGDAALNGEYLGIPTVDSGTVILPNLHFSAGQDLNIPVVLQTNLIVNSIQAEWTYDTSLLQVVGLPFVSGIFTMNEHNQSVPGEGRTRVVGVSSIPAVNNDTLFWIRLHAKANGSLKQALGLNQALLQPLLLSEGLEAYKLKLAFEPVSAQQQPVISSLPVQCIPNPFTSGAELALDLNQSTVVRLEVFDPTGRRTYQWEGPLSQGKNRLEIPGAALPQSGIGSYRLKAGREAVTGKLVRLSNF